MTHAALLYQPDREVEPNQRLFSLLETLASDAMVRYDACKTRKDKIGDDKPGKKTVNHTRSRHSFILKHASDVRLSEVRSHPSCWSLKVSHSVQKSTNLPPDFFLNNLSPFSELHPLLSLACGKTHTSGSRISYITFISGVWIETWC